MGSKKPSKLMFWMRLPPAGPSGVWMAVWTVFMIGGSATLVRAEIAFVDVPSEASGLDFVGSYGATFAGLTPAQARLQRNMGNGVAVGDYDGDGDLDVYLLGQLGRPNRLFRNNLDLGCQRFSEDVDARPVVGDTGLSRVAHFADFDNDGQLDLVLLNDDDGSGDYPSSRLYRNNGNATFTDVTAGSGFDPVGFLRCGMALADYDQDGLLDIYVTNWSYELGTGTPGFPFQNALYRNLGQFRFADVTDQVNLGGLARDSFSAVFADFNNDRFPDLYVAIDHVADEFYWNNNGVFASGAGVHVNHVGNDMGAACADLDDDGDLDIYTTNITDPLLAFGNGLYNCLYMNLEASPGEKPPPLGFTQFEDVALARGVGDSYWGWGVEFVDLENDGDLDIAAATGFDQFVLELFGPSSPVYKTPTVLLVNDSTGVFDRAQAPGLDYLDDSRALVAFDYDRDGDEDLLITNVNQPVRLLENVTAPRGHWLAVQLAQGAGLNRRGIGASIFAVNNGVTKRRDLICGDSYLAGTPAEAHLGLGALATIEELRVRWTDGSESVFRDVSADRLVRISNVPGDCNGNGLFETGDVEGFLDVLLGVADPPLCTTDFNGDGATDGKDVELFLDHLIEFGTVAVPVVVRLPGPLEWVGCPSNITATVEAARCEAVVAWDLPNAVGTCAEVTVDSTNKPGDDFEMGTTVVTYTATDTSGAAAECSFEVAVVDDESPVLECPADSTLEGHGAIEPSNTGDATAVDNCDSNPAVTSEDQARSGCPTVITRTWTATDSSGNSQSCDQLITVSDTTPPVITACAGDRILSADSACLAAVPDLSGDIVAGNDSGDPPTITQVPAVGTLIGLGDTEVTILISDECGNTAECRPTLTVVDDEPPIMTNCPESTLDVLLDASCNPIVPLFEALDGCSAGQGVLLVSDLDTLVVFFDAEANAILIEFDGQVRAIAIENVSASQPLDVFPVTVTATDQAGNSSICTMTVRVFLGEGVPQACREPPAPQPPPRINACGCGPGIGAALLLSMTLMSIGRMRLRAVALIWPRRGWTAAGRCSASVGTGPCPRVGARRT